MILSNVFCVIFLVTTRITSVHAFQDKNVIYLYNLESNHPNVFDQIHPEEETWRSLGTACWNGWLAVYPGKTMWPTRTRFETSRNSM